jgi:hypothetical protein
VSKLKGGPGQTHAPQIEQLHPFASALAFPVCVWGLSARLIVRVNDCSYRLAWLMGLNNWFREGRGRPS